MAADAEPPAQRPVRLLFVCMGNICRSPTAEAVMAHELDRAGLAGRVQLDSAGTGSWHVGEPPDPRSAAAAARRGIALAGAARQVTPEDLTRFDLVLAMDRSNRDALERMAPDAEARARVRLLREFDPAAVAAGDLDVPDPYYGEGDGFAHVLDVVQAGCAGLLRALREEGRL
jgi:protein-tyrosine phosphatase